MGKIFLTPQHISLFLNHFVSGTDILLDPEKTVKDLNISHNEIAESPNLICLEGVFFHVYEMLNKAKIVQPI